MAGPNHNGVAIRVRDLHKSYREGAHALEVLHGVNLDVLRGDLTLLMGPSGSGKTSLMMIIALFLVTAFMVFAMRSRSLIPSRVQSLAEITYEYVAGIVKEICEAKASGMKLRQLQGQ